MLFGSIWPLSAFICLVNNFFELRSDAVKFCIHSRRPVPRRHENIGIWVDMLSFLTWCASLINPLLCMYYQSWTGDSVPDIAYLSIGMIVVEHLYFLMNHGITYLVGILPTLATKEIRDCRFEQRRNALDVQEIDILAGQYGGIIKYGKDYESITKDQEIIIREGVGSFIAILEKK